MLLHHAIKYEYGGWRVWVDTLAIVHSKVSYEEFKLQFAQMYEHYEKHRTDNITDPALRQARPISTISGWDHQQRGDEVTPSNGKREFLTNKSEENHSNGKISEIYDDDDDNSDEDDDIEDNENNKNVQQQTTANEDVKMTTISNITDVYNESFEKTQPQSEATTPPTETEIVGNIINDILTDTEKFMKETNTTSSSTPALAENESSSLVLKDQEIELAVNELAEGVRQMEQFRDNNPPETVNDENFSANNIKNNNKDLTVDYYDNNEDLKLIIANLIDEVIENSIKSVEKTVDTSFDKETATENVNNVVLNGIDDEQQEQATTQTSLDESRNNKCENVDAIVEDKKTETTSTNTTDSKASTSTAGVSSTATMTNGANGE
jgi:hypothetical protein